MEFGNRIFGERVLLSQTQLLELALVNPLEFIDQGHSLVQFLRLLDGFRDNAGTFVELLRHFLDDLCRDLSLPHLHGWHWLLLGGFLSFSLLLDDLPLLAGVVFGLERLLPLLDLLLHGLVLSLQLLLS